MAHIKQKFRLNVLRFFSTLIDGWNAKNLCLTPWKFSAPLSVQKMNQYVTRWEDGCKYHAFLTRLDVGTSFERSIDSGFDTRQVTRHNFEIYFVKPYDGTGTQVHNEVDDSGVNLINETLNDVFECIGVGAPFDECTDHNDFDVVAWNAYPVIYAEDSNYTGWRVVGAFSQVVDRSQSYTQLD